VALRPFRFAVQTFSASTGAEWRDRARRIEDHGYAALHLSDHFLGPGPALERTNHPLQELAAVPAMAVAAEATSTLRIGCRVFCNDYRHPVVLAKEAATLDLLSGGRLELGVGAGWLAGEYAAAGLDFDPAPVRIARLGETLTLLKALLGEGPVSFKGEHYQVEGFEGAPRPVQKPHPPIMVGGGGKRVLSLAAREADIVSFNFNNRAGVLGPDGVLNSTDELTAEKVAWVKEAAGERFADLDLEIGAYLAFVGDHGAATARGMADTFGLSAEEMLRHPHGLFGTVDAICDELERRREATGIHYVTVFDPVIDAFAPVVARLSGR
jgi:probable F420-dependent oxidoreductase